MKVTKKILIITVMLITSFKTISAIPQHDSDQIKESKAEINIVRKLRIKILADNQLSTKAKNINIVSAADSITLIGPVSSRAEKVQIENYARSMAGTKKVYNRLTY